MIVEVGKSWRIRIAIAIVCVAIIALLATFESYIHSRWFALLVLFTGTLLASLLIFAGFLAMLLLVVDWRRHRTRNKPDRPQG